MSEREAKYESKELANAANLSNGDLVLNQKFTYQFFQKNRYTISELGNYEALCNNGFIKLYTKQCRVYWHAQNQFSHEVQDWKFHVSVSHKHLKAAWNLIAALFFKLKCRAGMKVIYLNEANSPQEGRQITLYLIKYDPKFRKSAFASDFSLDIDIQHSEDYWLQMYRQIQNLLESYNIQSNGLAPGDFPLGKYISLRNQAFVRNSLGESIYPPNSSGWNPLSHQLPISLEKFKELFAPQSESKNSFPIKIIIGIGLVVSAVWIKLNWKVAK